jgi:hypothetical protein
MNTEGYILWGHSAGAQFVHRLLAVKSNDREMSSGTPHLLRAVAANAGSYMMPSFQEKFPFGFGGLSSIGVTSITPFIQVPLLVLLGQDDTDTNHKTIPKDREGRNSKASTGSIADYPFFMQVLNTRKNTERSSAGRSHLSPVWPTMAS